MKLCQHLHISIVCQLMYLPNRNLHLFIHRPNYTDSPNLWYPDLP